MRLTSLPLSLLISTLYLLLNTVPVLSNSNSPSNDPSSEASASVRDFFDRNALTSDSLAESESVHTNNWAVLVCASRYWFNYRVRSLSVLFVALCRRCGILEVADLVCVLVVPGVTAYGECVRNVRFSLLVSTIVPPSLFFSSHLRHMFIYKNIRHIGTARSNVSAYPTAKSSSCSQTTSLATRETDTLDACLPTKEDIWICMGRILRWIIGGMKLRWRIS